MMLGGHGLRHTHGVGWSWSEAVHTVSGGHGLRQYTWCPMVGGHGLRQYTQLVHGGSSWVGSLSVQEARWESW